MLEPNILPRTRTNVFWLTETCLLSLTYLIPPFFCRMLHIAMDLYTFFRRQDVLSSCCQDLSQNGFSSSNRMETGSQLREELTSRLLCVC